MSFASKKPKISLVTPSYNSGKYIRETISSVLSQDYDNFEYFVIDGGSTDNTVKILKKYPHLKWVSEPDEGQSDALNKGLKMATGEIIGDNSGLSGTVIGAAEKIQIGKNVLCGTNVLITDFDLHPIDPVLRHTAGAINSAPC